MLMNSATMRGFLENRAITHILYSLANNNTLNKGRHAYIDNKLSKHSWNNIWDPLNT